MERYTYFEDGKWRIRIGDTEHSGPWVDRLAAYEDTGLEPEGIDEALNEAHDLGYQACLNYKGSTWQEAAELQAYRALGTVEELTEKLRQLECYNAAMGLMSYVARAEAEAATGGV